MEADPIACADDKGSGVNGVGVVNNNGGGGGGSSQQDTLASDDDRIGDGERVEVCERREWNWRELIRKWSEEKVRVHGIGGVQKGN